MYKPIAWKKGDVITTQRLKHLQQGIVDTQKQLSNYNNQVLNVKINKTNQTKVVYTMNKTANQIWNALIQDKMIIVKYLNNDNNNKQIYRTQILTQVEKEQEGNFLFFLNIPNLAAVFKTKKGDEYPTYVGF